MLVRVACVAALMAAPAAWAWAGDDEGPSVESKRAIARALKPSLARVEYTLQFDKGEAPQMSGWEGAGMRYGGYRRGSWPSVITEERPLEVAAFVLSPTRVVTPDPMLHPRFVKAMAVRFGDQVVQARIAAYPVGQGALILDLERPLRGARPLTFDATKKPPYLLAEYAEADGAWTVGVGAFRGIVAVTESGRTFLPGLKRGLVVDAKGNAVGMAALSQLPADDSWKGSPLKWPALTAKERQTALDKVEAGCRRGVLRVALSFRSPKKGTRDRYSRYGDESRTELNVLGGLIDKNRVLVLANLRPKVTARLRRIVIHPAGGDSIPAAFAYTLKDYGAFVVKLAKPLPGALIPVKKKITDFRNALLLAAEIRLRGEERTTHYGHARIDGFRLGWRRRIFPEVRGGGSNVLLFDVSGRMVAIPLARREKVGGESRWRSEEPGLTPATHLAEPLFGDPAKHADQNNVPLPEKLEARLAWLGTELQGLNQELARFNKASDLTGDGTFGALVSYVYPRSPAAQADIRVGDILVRMHVEGQPKPLGIRVQEDRYAGRPFPWRRYDAVTERYFDRIPPPWPPTENSFTRVLTDLGFGKPFVLEVSRAGTVLRKKLSVTQCPPHYDAAERYKSKVLGLTVRNLTFEVRRYFQKTAGDPGVIVSKIEPGSKASVSGIKPYEIITHVDDRPVASAAEFGRLAARRGELRLSVKRMTMGRVVKINTVAPKKPAGGE